MDKELLASRYLPAARRSLEHFPVVVDNIEAVSLSENVTFRVSGRDTDYVLRLHRPGYNSHEELNAERCWTMALSEAGILVPEPLRTNHGEFFARVDLPAANESRYAGMTTWIDGTPLSEHLEAGVGENERQQIFARIGVITAALHNQTAEWEEPPGFTRQRLDLDGLLGDAPRWGRFWEHAGLTKPERVLLLQVREAFRSALAAYGESAAHFGLIHADLHPDNIIYNGTDLALIDFDDSAYGWHMYDIATALIDEYRATDFDALLAALLQGYRRNRALPDQDLGTLPMFLVIRGMAIIGWLHERPEHAGSGYFERVRRRVIEQCQQFVR